MSGAHRAPAAPTSPFIATAAPAAHAMTDLLRLAIAVLSATRIRTPRTVTTGSRPA